MKYAAPSSPLVILAALRVVPRLGVKDPLRVGRAPHYCRARCISLCAGKGCIAYCWLQHRCRPARQVIPESRNGELGRRPRRLTTRASVVEWLPRHNPLKDNAVYKSSSEMPKVVIENPILNSPYDEPTRHFYFDEDGITDRVVDSRRISTYFVPIPKPKKRKATRTRNRVNRRPHQRKQIHQ